MPQMNLAHDRRGYYGYSWTTGPVRFAVPEWDIKNDTDAMAYLVYLCRNGKRDEADAFLDHYCAK